MSSSRMPRIPMHMVLSALLLREHLVLACRHIRMLLRCLDLRWHYKVIKVSMDMVGRFIEIHTCRFLPCPPPCTNRSHLHARSSAVLGNFCLNFGNSGNLYPSSLRKRRCHYSKNHPCQHDTCHPVSSGPSDRASDRSISLLLAVPSAAILQSAALTKDGTSGHDHPLENHVFVVLAIVERQQLVVYANTALFGDRLVFNVPT